MKTLWSCLLVSSAVLFYAACEEDATGPDEDDTLSAPTNLTVGEVTDSTISLSWTDNSSGEVGFKVERSLEATGGFSLIGSVGQDVTTYTDTGLDEETTYYYQVNGYDDTEISEYSDVVSATTGETYYGSFSIETVMSLSAGEDANAEIIRTVPGSDNQAVFVSSAVNKLTVIDYTPTSFAFSADYDLDPGSATAEMTSLDVSPLIDGENYVAVCVAETDCALGKIMFVEFSTGTIVSEVTVGYNPDGTAFTKDGSYLIVACEDDREDRPCKPADRWGGSVSIIDLTGGVANATLVLDFPVNWAEDSEPEHCETSSDGTVIVSVQETSQILIFNVSDVTSDTISSYTVVDLPTDAGGTEAEPDGLFISPDGTMALISSERNGTFQMMSLPDGALLHDPYIVEDDLPDGWQRDNRSYKKRTEPEECSLVEQSGKLYAVFALQESHAVIVYDVTDPANPVFDSMAPAGIDWEGDDGMEKSLIGSEGLGMHPTNGIAFSANEREGSITMFTASWARE